MTNPLCCLPVEIFGTRNCDRSLPKHDFLDATPDLVDLPDPTDSLKMESELASSYKQRAGGNDDGSLYRTF